MSLGTWDPNAAATVATLEIKPELLPRYASFSQQNQLPQLAEMFDETALSELRPLLKVEPVAWAETLAAFDNDLLLHLIRFFTVAEALPDCEAGATSPVIPMAKLLRQRGERLDKTLLQWIRENSINRFLPYGPL
ncbi:hypothetical protein EYC98_20120 [Halieaceae bacterium IMCC14734]|uniref:Uncharacterized protein n=1 Tax=Candidatus Litorirhabdus singularis TaxID=2518993 RepID=A0ABT3TP54_9GAMM|nr:hypothetical protein [Candidatus Litorirhabdus singularis]MCX2983174.1 hypothetical protein [Candidatus Litorirhabdus singularis]